MVKYSWSDSQPNSGDVVHVFSSSFSETADVKITTSVAQIQYEELSKHNHSSLPFINRDMQD